MIVKCLINNKQGDRAMNMIKEMICNGFMADEYVWNFYYKNICKNNRVIEAFTMARNNGIGNHWLYNVFVKQAGSIGDFKTSWALIAHMIKTGFEPNEMTFDAVISSYFKFKKTEEAFQIVRATNGHGIASARIFNTAMRSSLKLGLTRYVRIVAAEMDFQSILMDIDARQPYLDCVDPLTQ